MKDMKLKTKLILGFMIPIILTVINVIIGNSTSSGIVKSDNQETYLLYSTIFTTAIAAVSVLIALFIAFLLYTYPSPLALSKYRMPASA